MTPAEFAELVYAFPEFREWTEAHCKTMDEVWNKASMPDWIVWIATRKGVLDDRTLRKFAVWCARQVQHLITDRRNLDALDVAERHSNGLATDNELYSAYDIAGAPPYCIALARESAWRTAFEIAWDNSWTAREARASNSWIIQAAWLRENATPDWERVRKMNEWNWAIGREITVKQILPDVCRAWVILADGVEYRSTGIDPIDAVGKLKWVIESDAAKNAKRVKIRGSK